MFLASAVVLVVGSLTEAYPRRTLRARRAIPSYYFPHQSGYAPSAAFRAHAAARQPNYAVQSAYGGGGGGSSTTTPTYTVTGSVEVSLPVVSGGSQWTTTATGTFSGRVQMSDEARREIESALRSMREGMADAHRHYGRAMQATSEYDRDSELQRAWTAEEEALRCLEKAVLR